MSIDPRSAIAEIHGLGGEVSAQFLASLLVEFDQP
jgi:hypothetical protein